MMRLIQCIYLLVLCIGMGACASSNEPFAYIKGTYTGDADSHQISLCQVENGSTQIVATTNLGSEGRFAFAWHVNQPGMYVVNVMDKQTGKPVVQDHGLNRFYLANGVNLEVQLEDSKYDLLQSNCDKNQLLSQWNAMADSMYTLSHGFLYNHYTYEEYFPALDFFEQQAGRFLSQINTKDEAFNELLPLVVETDRYLSALTLLYTPRPKHPDSSQLPAVYQELSEKGAPVNRRLLDIATGMNYMRKFTMYKALNDTTPKRSSLDFLRLSLQAVPDSLLRGYLAVDNLEAFQTYDDAYRQFKKLMEPFLLNDDLKNKVRQYEMVIRKFETGAPAYNFKGKDAAGNWHQLSDYEGSIVYVDVWATWCGPCKSQLPYLMNLEEKYRNQPITFLSISVDKPADFNKWKAFVEEKEMKGVQLMAEKGFDSDLVDVYGITGIPRFMLFDAKGNVVSIDAQPPSHPDIEQVLDNLLR